MRRELSGYKGILLTLITILFSFIILSCGGSDSGSSNTDESTTTVSGTVQADPNDTTADGQEDNATVYVVGQENNAVQTDSNGNFDLTVDTTLSGTVLSGPAFKKTSLAGAAGTKTYGLVVISSAKSHGKKTKITVTDNQVDPISTIYINTVGSITGKAKLEGQTDHTGILVYIPGTSFSAHTAADGSFTISGVPSGEYDFVRADKSGYHYAISSEVTVNSNAATNLSDMLLQLDLGPDGKILINAGADYTTSNSVTLNIAASSNAVRMMLSEKSDFVGAVQEAVQSTKAWTFSGDYSTGGTAKIYAKFEDATGVESGVISDSIYIDTDPKASLVSPTDGGNTASTKPTLDWKYDPLMPNPKYHVEIGESNSCSMTPKEEATDLTASQYTISTALNNGVTYYWCVAIIDGTGHEWNWAGPWSFTVDLGTVDLITPVNTSVINDSTPTFSWSANANAVTYTHYIEGPNSSSTNTTHTVSGTSYVPVSSIGSEGTYTWKVTPVDQFGKSGSTSSPFSFVLDTTTPAGEPISGTSGTGTGIVINNNDILAASNQFTITLSATDVNKVNGYYVSTSSSSPDPESPQWVAISPVQSYSTSTNMTFSDISSSGTATIFAWFRDVAGNVSDPYPDSIEYIKFEKVVLDAGGSGRRVGGASSIATSSTGTVHISYVDYNNQNLLYIAGNAVSWQTPTVLDSNGSDSFARTTSLDVDSIDNVHISYYDQSSADLKYLFYDNATWSTPYTVDSLGDVGYQSSLSVDNTGRVHISYSGSSKLKYAQKVVSSWTTTTVPGTSVGGNYNAIATNSTGTQVHISYFISETTKHAYSSDAGTTWDTANIISSTIYPYNTSVAVDSAGNVHSCYPGYATSGNLSYSKYSSGAWGTPVKIDDSPGNCSITVGPDDRVHIVYDSGGVLKYATFINGSWASATIDDGGSYYYYMFQPDIAVDTNGIIHVSYYEEWYDGAYYDSLKYARSE